MKSILIFTRLGSPNQDRTVLPILLFFLFINYSHVDRVTFILCEFLFCF